MTVQEIGQLIISDVSYMLWTASEFLMKHIMNLRMVSKGHLPPLGRLAKEKKKCHRKIPYKKHPKVSKFGHNFEIKKYFSSVYLDNLFSKLQEDAIRRPLMKILGVLASTSSGKRN